MATDTLNMNPLAVASTGADNAAMSTTSGGGSGKAGNNNLPVVHIFGRFDGQKITLHDPYIAHGHAFDPQQIVWLLGKQGAFDLVGAVHMLLRQDGETGGHTADQGKAQRCQVPWMQGEYI